MAEVALHEIAVARSGDKGDSSNVGIMAKSDALYQILSDHLTEERVAEHFSGIAFGEVTRFELPNLRSLNFLLGDSLGGGGSETLITDAQGKVHGLALLHLVLEVPDELLADI